MEVRYEDKTDSGTDYYFYAVYVYDNTDGKLCDCYECF